jgi:hypothetical protein
MSLCYFGILHFIQIYFDPEGFIVTNASSKRTIQGRRNQPPRFFLQACGPGLS